MTRSAALTVLAPPHWARANTEELVLAPIQNGCRTAVPGPILLTGTNAALG